MGWAQPDLRRIQVCNVFSGNRMTVLIHRSHNRNKFLLKCGLCGEEDDGMGLARAASYSGMQCFFKK
jgi:hypothetical protein